MTAKLYRTSEDIHQLHQLYAYVSMLVPRLGALLTLTHQSLFPRQIPHRNRDSNFYMCSVVLMFLHKQLAVRNNQMPLCCVTFVVCQSVPVPSVSKGLVEDACLNPWKATNPALRCSSDNVVYFTVSRLPISAEHALLVSNAWSL